MFEFRFAESVSDLECQKQIWRDCFGDPDDFIEMYYNSRYDAGRTMLCIVDGVISAMLTIIPTSIISSDGNKLITPCLYAIATDPKKQGLGIATALINHANEYLAQNGADGSILVPASEGLISFYHKKGYEPIFWTNELHIDAKDIPFVTNGEMKTLQILAPKYNSVRKDFLNKIVYVDYEIEDIKYQGDLCKYCNGGMLISLSKGPVYGCAAVEVYGDHVMAKELLMPDALLGESLSAIQQLFPANRYTFRMPPNCGTKLGAVNRPFGMVKWFNNSKIMTEDGAKAYMGIAFD